VLTPSAPSSSKTRRGGIDSQIMTSLIDAESLMAESDLLFSYALQRVRDRHRAEDLVQDVLVTAWQERERFDGRSCLSTWLVGIMKFKILDHFRFAKRITPS